MGKGAASKESFNTGGKASKAEAEPKSRSHLSRANQPPTIDEWATVCLILPIPLSNTSERTNSSLTREKPPPSL